MSNSHAPVLLFIMLFAVWAVFAERANYDAHQHQKQPGACVVHAAEEAAKHADARILLIRYNEIAIGHAYCVYREGGRTFAWDWRGPVELAIPDTADDAESTARWLTVIDPPLDEPLTVRSAAYEWTKKP